MIMDWRPALAEHLVKANKITLLGIGSPLKNDDAAGMLLIEDLIARGLDNGRILLLPGSTAPENFTGVIRDFAPELLLAVDAARMGLAPGSVALVEAEEQAGLDFSTHMLPFAVMLRYLAADGLTNALLIGIEPQNTEFGFNMSPPVQTAVRELADFFAEELV